MISDDVIWRFPASLQHGPVTLPASLQHGPVTFPVSLQHGPVTLPGLFNGGYDVISNITQIYPQQCNLFFDITNLPKFVDPDCRCSEKARIFAYQGRYVSLHMRVSEIIINTDTDTE